MKRTIYFLLALIITSCVKNTKHSFKLEKELIKTGFIKTSIEKETTGHILLSVKINEKKARFVVDTGASNSVIDENQKERLNINAAISDIVATGAGRTDIPIAIAKNVKLEINSLLLDNKEFIVMNLDHVNLAIMDYNGQRVDGIIGSDILTEIHAIIDYNDLNIFMKLKSN